ncbi:hypothetical protein GIB67_025785 [Kingdonia uniflora]|uniref:NAC domain-containing protein n=1 Tax=Kingdonia uniflora TaxID=39325 RepID=A0A7J7NSD5_9MAGN|nr:hypothetical protein GIB67_025785 [Kingdonia uniflora]
MADQTLRPGFRFAPTDEELINYYLKPKVLGEEYPLDVIQEIDVTNFEPWDLLGESRECYYFTSLDKKYINGKKTNRTTRNGFWKTTGRDTPIRSNGQVVGTRKILVFHRGRSKDKKRTNWVMHEFSLGQTTQVRKLKYSDFDYAWRRYCFNMNIVRCFRCVGCRIHL